MLDLLSNIIYYKKAVERRQRETQYVEQRKSKKLKKVLDKRFSK